MQLKVPCLPIGKPVKDAMGGYTTYSLDQANAIADGYDPIGHKAFVVLGHAGDPEFISGDMPSDSLPSFGWIKSLVVEAVESMVYAVVDFVDEAIDWVERGLYDYYSLGLYDPDNDFNPNPGEFYPRHLALLGASPPAIKGLPPLSTLFSEGNDNKNVIVLFSECQSMKDKDKTKQYNEEEELQELEDQLDADEADEALEDELDEAEAEAEDSEAGDAEAEGIEWLNGNAGEYLRDVLSQGDSGYKGEITKFDPEPSDDNNWLMQEDGSFAGVFVDESLGDEQRFTFQLEPAGDGGWSMSYYPEGSTEAEAEAEMEEADAEAQLEEANDEAEEAELEDDDEVLMGEDKMKKYTDMKRMYGGIKKKAKAYSEENMQLRRQLAEMRRREVAQLVGRIYSEGKLTEGQLPKAQLTRLASALSVIKPNRAYSEAKTSPLADLEAVLNLLRPVVAYGEQLSRPGDIQATGGKTQKAGTLPGPKPRVARNVTYSEAGIQLDALIRNTAAERGLDLAKPGVYGQLARELSD